MSDIQVGDYIVPVTVIDGIDVSDAMTPCRVLNVFKNGNLLARSDDHRVEWRGLPEGFRKAVTP